MSAADANWQDAWLLLAVKYAQSPERRATREQVIRAADYINHAIPTEEELEHGVNVLVSLKLIRIEKGEFQLGSGFRLFWENSGAEEHRSVNKQLRSIEEALNVM